jgi:hypothetical protein
MSFGVRVFDTVLDNKRIKDTVSRNSANFWGAFTKAAGWDFSYERVHSLGDLEHFLGRVIKEDVIIFSGHGSDSGWHLTNGECFVPGAIPATCVHSKNQGKIIIFSSCLIGKSLDRCSQYKTFFSAESVFAYRHIMCDSYCFLNESILLSVLADTKGKIDFAGFDEFKRNTLFMKNMNQKRVKLHPMVMV